QKLGQEPCSLERYAEISGAQAAWGQSGADVTANLKKVFNLRAVDISNLGAYWSTRFASDPNLSLKFGDLLQKYEEKYGGAGQDDDLEA
ncbi:MAG: hypothetical protein HY901_32665, partial [Deltaproteobacteria bacterium]|nr:hypothetical protein [Deltaproteobacteria bacterium]